MNAHVEVALPVTDESATESALVWDLPLRVFHWALVVSVAAAFITHQLGVDYFVYHQWSGYAVIVLLVFRLGWGIVGPRHARFVNFVRSPLATVRYARSLRQQKQKHSAGHNPLGAWMVLLLVGGFLLQAVAGLFADDQIFNVGPLQHLVSSEVSLWLTSLHRNLFYWLAGAIGLHVAAVFAHWLLWRDNLVTAMFNGRKSLRHLQPADIIPSSRLGLALVLLGVSVAALATLIVWAAGVQL